MLSIGEFSRICFVSKKTLRYYDEIGLLRPEHTAENGYRYYSVQQLQSMLLISRLKSYAFSLPEIAAVMASPSQEFLAQKLLEKRNVLQTQLENTQHILQQLEEDVQKLNRRENIMQQNITVKTIELEPQNIYSIRKKINVKDFSELIGSLFEKMGRENIQPVGPPMAFYHEEDFNPESTEVEVAVPVGAASAATRQISGLHCFATILGEYKTEKFTATYAALQKWIEENNYRFTGPPFEKYVRGGTAGENPAENITEIYFPIAPYTAD